MPYTPINLLPDYTANGLFKIYTPKPWHHRVPPSQPGRETPDTKCMKTVGLLEWTLVYKSLLTKPKPPPLAPLPWALKLPNVYLVCLTWQPSLSTATSLLTLAHFKQLLLCHQLPRTTLISRCDKHWTACARCLNVSPAIVQGAGTFIYCYH